MSFTAMVVWEGSLKDRFKRYLSSAFLCNDEGFTPGSSGKYLAGSVPATGLQQRASRMTHVLSLRWPILFSYNFGAFDHSIQSILPDNGSSKTTIQALTVKPLRPENHVWNIWGM